MSIEWYFNQKKQRFVNFFERFHVFIDAIKKSCQSEMDREYDVAKSVLNKCQPGVMESEFAKMASRELPILLKIVDEICFGLKEQISSQQKLFEHSRLKTVEKSNIRPISLGKPNTSHDRQQGGKKLKFESPQRFTVYETPMRRNQSSEILRMSKNNERIIQTPIQQYKALQVEQKIKKTLTDYSLTCEKLDKKIEEQGLSLLYKQKLQRSPSRRRNSHANTKNKSIIYQNQYLSGYQRLEKLNHKLMN